jgi:hypothetical protein
MREEGRQPFTADPRTSDRVVLFGTRPTKGTSPLKRFLLKRKTCGTRKAETGISCYAPENFSADKGPVNHEFFLTARSGQTL